MNQRRCMAVPLRTTSVNDGGITDNHDAKYLDSIRCLYGQAGSATGSYDYLRFDGDRGNDF